MRASIQLGLDNPLEKHTSLDHPTHSHQPFRSDSEMASKQAMERANEAIERTSGSEEDRRQALEDARQRILYQLSVAGLGRSPGQTALCLSGGGIRSAAFGLGILQGLARRKLLDQFHYLSTVSGGGYIGSWLTAWRHREGLEKVVEGLNERKFGEIDEPMPMQRLRFNQNFLTPKVGLTSADTWTALGTLVRNLFLNWLVYLPLIAGILILPRAVCALLDAVAGPQPPAASSIAIVLNTVLHLFHSQLPYSRNLPPLNDVLPYCIPTSCNGRLNWSHLRDWVDAAAAALIAIAFVASARNRPVNSLTSMTERRFGMRVLFPASSGAVLLTAAVWSWDMVGGITELLNWAIIGVLVYVLARLIAPLSKPALLVKGTSEPSWSEFLVEILLKFRDFLVDIIGWALAGLCTAPLVGGGAMLGLWDKLTVQQFAAYGPPWILASFLVGEFIYVGATSRRRNADRDREWLARAGGLFGMVALTYLAVSSLVLFGWEDVKSAGLQVQYLFATAGVGLLSILGALSPLSRAAAAAASKERFPITGIVALLSALFILGLSATVAEGTLDLLTWASQSMHTRMRWPLSYACQHIYDRPYEPLCERKPWIHFVVVLAAFGSLLFMSQVFSVFINVNLFSLHAFYRNRLVRTFLGASNYLDATEGGGEKGHANRADAKEGATLSTGSPRRITFISRVC